MRLSLPMHHLGRGAPFTALNPTGHALRRREATEPHAEAIATGIIAKVERASVARSTSPYAKAESQGRMTVMSVAPRRVIVQQI